MINEVLFQEGQTPLDEHLRPLKIGGEVSALEIAQSGNGARVTGDLEITGLVDSAGDITLSAGGDVIIKGDTKLYLNDAGGEYLNSDGTNLTIASGNAFACTAGGSFTMTGGDTPIPIIMAGTTKTASSSIDKTVWFIETLNLSSGAGGSDVHYGLNYNQTQTDLTGWDDVYLMYISGGDAARTFAIRADGKVGIGVTDPDSLLEVFGESAQLRLSWDASNHAAITVADDGHLELATTGTDADITLDSDGDIDISSDDGNFIMRKGDTEFSPANSAYAGMILGYTRISNDSTTTGHAEINPSATMTVLQTAQGTDVSVTFTAPPSGNVEISMLCAVYANSRTLEFALSDNASFNEIAETHTYDSGAQGSDETDQNMTYVSFVNTGLTAGTSYERWIGAAETVSGTSAIRHGRNRTGGTHYPPIIVKAIALPSTITTGE